MSHAPKVTTADARVDWSRPAALLDRQVRACTPDPGAWTLHEGARLRLGPVRPDPSQPPLGPGEVVVAKHSVHVGTGTDPVRLDEVTPVGKRRMPAADWARGARPTHLG